MRRKCHAWMRRCTSKVCKSRQSMQWYIGRLQKSLNPDIMTHGRGRHVPAPQAFNSGLLAAPTGTAGTSAGGHLPQLSTSMTRLSSGKFHTATTILRMRFHKHRCLPSSALQPANFAVAWFVRDDSNEDASVLLAAQFMRSFLVPA